MPQRLLQHLVSRSLVTQAQADEALRISQTTHVGIDTALLELGHVSEAGMLQALSDLSGFKLVNLADFEPNREAAAWVPLALASSLNLTPLSIEGRTVHLAVGYPVPADVADQAKKRIGFDVELWVALDVRIRDWRSHIYQIPLDVAYARTLAQLDPTRKPARLQLGDLVVPADGVAPEVLDFLARHASSPPSRLAKRAAPGQPPLGRGPISESRSPPLVTSIAVDSVDAAPEPPTPVLPPPNFAPTLHGVETASAKPHLVGDATLPGIPVAAAQATAGSATSRAAAVAPSPTPPPPALRPDRVAPATRGIELPPVAAAPTSPLSPGQATTPSPKPQPAPTAPAPRAADDRWSLESARAAAEAASGERDALIDVVIQFVRTSFDFAAVWGVNRGAALGWKAGSNEGETSIRTVTVPLEAQSIFGAVVSNKTNFMGPPPADGLTSHYLSLFGRKPAMVFLWPVVVSEKVVALVYADSAQPPFEQHGLPEIIAFCQSLAGPFGQLILARRKPGAARRTPAAQATPSEAAKYAGWSAEQLVAEAMRPGADLPALTAAFALTDATASAALLVQAFPGRPSVGKLPVTSIPSLAELGVVPTLLAKSPQAAHALAPLLNSGNNDVRYYALLTAAWVPKASLSEGVMLSLFHEEPDVASAARAAAQAFVAAGLLGDKMETIRAELASNDPLRKSLAARALGALHDQLAVDKLIALTADVDALVAGNAAEALREISKRNFGSQTAKWRSWWLKAQNKPRSHWLVEALDSEEFDERLSAIEELSRRYGGDLGYFADATPAGRATAIQAWRRKVSDPTVT